jgi:hypothetical protein
MCDQFFQFLFKFFRPYPGGKKSGEIQNLDNILGFKKNQVKDPKRKKNFSDATVEPFVGKFD